MATQTSSFEEYESELRTWTDRLKVVDSLLDRPSATLIRELRRVTDEANAVEKSTPEDVERNPWRVASTIDKRGRGDRAPLLVHAICCSAVQRLWAQRRRFAWLDENGLKPLVADITKPFLQLEEASGNDVFRLIDSLADEVFGAGNALTAAEIFWVLIKTGEKQAHGPLGFYCLFAMLWSLARGASLSPSDGATIDPWRPSALVTAKCLLPLRRLIGILRQRAKLYAEIAASYERLQKSRSNTTQRERWLFVTALEALSSHLHEFASVAVNPDDYNEAARKLAARAAPITPDFDRTRLDQLFAMTTTYLGRLLVDSANAAGPAMERAQVLLDEIKIKIVDVLDAGENLESRSELLSHMPQLGPLKNDAGYWAQHFEAAREAFFTCKSACIALQRGVAECRRHDTNTVESSALLESLQTLSDVNIHIAELVEVSVDASTHWMRRTLTQEVAYASAGNDTDFDAAELLSAVTIVQRWHRISDLEVEDALKWSLKSARSDGSWSTGQPIFLKHRMLGVWPSTPEVAWLLAMAVERKKLIRVADDALIGFVTWLDKTRIELSWATWLSGGKADYHEESGWPSETREHDTIDLWSTALSINALLSIRDLIEERLWTLCERRFFVQTPRSTLDTIDPVDLGAKHEARLHHRLMRMARNTTGDDYKNADYALVLHGPPGSSKTALAEALANAMWVGSRQARLVRITPADFTRQGEERVDSEARFIFDLLSRIRGATIFFDEIDQLLQRRSPGDPLSFLKLVVPAMLNRLQDLRDAAPRQEICFVFATNFVDMIDPALTRPGRIDAAVPVPYPDPWSRENVMERVFGKRKPLDDRQKRRVIKKTNGWPWSTFQKLCKEIREKPPRHVREIDLPIERRQADFEESENYYGNPARWESGSRPFARELAHATFAFSKDEEVCRAKLDEILDRVKPKIDVVSVFKTEWSTVDHRSSITGDEADRWQTVDGATARTSGMTLRSDGSADFRVWAPFALQVAIAGTFNDWSRTRHELSRDPEFPGFWKGSIAGVTEFPPPSEPEPEPADAETAATENSASTPKEEPEEQPVAEPAEEPVRIPQYRYVVTMDTVEQLLRSDPFSYELIDIPAFSVHNTVITASPPKESNFTPVPLEALVIYQLHPATFSDDDGGPGTLRSAVARLDGLKNLGVNAIEILMLGDPLYDEPWGYDAEFPLAIRTSAGGAAAMRDFIEEAHARGMAVIVGARWHNIGRWVDSSTDSSIMKRHVADGGLWQFDGWPADENDGGIFYKGNSFQLELEQREVRDYLLEVALRWTFDMHVDGLRWNDVGAVLAMDRSNAPDLLRDVVRVVSATSFITIAQDDDERQKCIDDYGFRALWKRSFMEQMHSVLHKNENEPFDLDALAAEINGDVVPLTSHVLYSDSYREAEQGRFPRQDGHDFTRRRRAMFGAILVFTSPGIPMIFQGQEDLAGGSFGPDVMLGGPADEGMRRFYADLIRLRTVEPATRALRGPSAAADADHELVLVHRTNENDYALVVLNFSGNYLNHRVPVPADGDWIVHLNTADDKYGPGGTNNGSSGKLVAQDGLLRIEVERWSAMILAHADEATPAA